MMKSNRMLVVIIVLVLLSSCFNNSNHSISSKSSTMNYSYNKEEYLDDLSLIDFENISYEFNVEIKDTEEINATMHIVFTSKIENELTEIVFHTYTNSYRSLDTIPSIYGIVLDKFGEIIINNVSSKGTLLTFIENNQYLQIDLENPLKFNDIFELDIDFTVIIPISNSRLGYYNDICSITQWYPMLSKYSSKTNTWDKKDYSLLGESDFVNDSSFFANIKYPKNYFLASSGIDNLLKTEDDIKYTSSYLEHGRSFVFVYSNKFTIVEETRNNIKIRYFYNRYDFFIEDSIEGISSELFAAIDFFENKLGTFIYKEEFDIVETGIKNSAMEYSGLIQVGKYLGTQSGYHILVHEIAHQWFNSKVGSNSSLQPFIDEGFCTFMVGYFYNEYFKETSKYMSFNYIINSFKEHIFIDPLSYGTDYYDLLEDKYSYTLSIYYGSTLLLHELFSYDQAMFDTLLTVLIANYSYKFLTVTTLLEEMLLIYGEKITYSFFDCLNMNGYYYGCFDLLIKS